MITGRTPANVNDDYDHTPAPDDVPENPPATSAEVGFPPVQDSAPEPDPKDVDGPNLQVVVSNSPADLAAAAAAKAVNLRWKTKLLKSGKTTRKILANALLPLREADEWKDALRYDASALRVVVYKPPPWAAHPEGVEWIERLWSDQDDHLFAEWLQRHGIDVSVPLAGAAVQCVARENSFHPIKEYLDDLVWDGRPRVMSWLTTYLGVEANEFSEAVGMKWLVSGVARVLGIEEKADCMLILLGKQGLGKSTALMTLAGEWFTDEIRDMGGRDTAMSLAGKWIIEFSELEGFKGASLERLKAFLSRTVDRFRPPYGRVTVDSPRQCIFVGTTNNKDIFQDATGNRRFWPVVCGMVGPVDVPALRRDRDQLWAEAKNLYDRRKELKITWWLDSQKLQRIAAAEVDKYHETDMHEDDIADWVSRRTEFQLVEFFEEFFGMEDTKGVPRGDQKKVINILQKLGWEKVRVWERNNPNRGRWVYRKVDDPSSASD